MNPFQHRLNAVAARLPFAATLDPERRKMIEDTALRYDVDVGELTAEVERTVSELAAADVADPDAQVRFICERDGLDVDAVFAELYGEGRIA
jgi:hypothetical protein